MAHKIKSTKRGKYKNKIKTVDFKNVIGNKFHIKIARTITKFSGNLRSEIQ